MNSNRANQTQGNQLVQRIAALEREVRAQKTIQPVAGDNLVMDKEVYQTATPLIVAPGESAGFLLGAAANLIKPGWWVSEVGLEVYVDVDGDPGHLFGLGGGLSSDQQKLMIGGPIWISQSSDESDGVKTYFFNFYNYGTDPKTLYIHATLLFPKLNLS